ncbi:MAG: zinc-ribbon domain-containing protein [Desulfobacterales bacterium]|nr:zinc-ribbon domain-containing protein [Desulfobacterales bacterium]
MIIACENCKTEFNLDENLVKESGSKVRCSRCQHIFTAYKSSPAEELEPGIELEERTPDQAAHLAEPAQPFAEEDETEAKAPEVSEEASEEALDFDLVESEEQPVEEEISLEDFGLEEEGAAEETAQAAEQPAAEEEISMKDLLEEEPALEQARQPTEQVAEEEISLEDFRLEEEGAAEETAQAAEQPAAEEEMLGAEDEISMEDLLEDETAAEEIPEPTEELEEEITQDLIVEEAEFEKASMEDEIALEETAVLAEVDESALLKDVSVASLEGSEAFEAQQLEEESTQELVLPSIAETEPPARKRISTPLLVLLIFVLMGGGAYGAYTVLKNYDSRGFHIKIPFLEFLTGKMKPETIDPGNMHIALLEQLITGEFVDNNAIIGRLFVIRGKIRNEYLGARSSIRVKGVLYSKGGKIARDRVVYCGNFLSDTELQTLDRPAINEKLGNRFGDKKANLKVPSGKVLPFMLVFADLPPDLGEFSVEVVGSTPG